MYPCSPLRPRARSDIVWVGCYSYLRRTLQAGGWAAATEKRRTAMNGYPPRKPKSARRVAFSKWAFVGAIAGAALISACSQPSDSQQTAEQHQPADEQARKDADEKAWADAEKTNTAAAYTAYLQNFGAGAHVSEASQRIVALNEAARKAADEKAWADAEKAGTAAAYTAYIQNFGGGAHVAEARQLVTELSRKEADEKAWADAVKAGTATAFNGYIQKFGSGAHVAEARQRAAALETQARKQVPTIDIQKTCQVAAGAMLSLMGGTTTEQDVNACLDSEQKARDQLVKDLATYSSAYKAQCMRTDVYLPSYVEWLTCLEMERDVRKERRQEETIGQGGPYTLPKVNTVSASRAGVSEVRANDFAQRASKPARVSTRLAAPRRRAARRGSGGPYAPARLTAPSLPLAQQSTGVYIPPPVSNPSAQINQLNQSFQFNRGLGNNPTGRDLFIRYNLTR